MRQVVIAAMVMAGGLAAAPAMAGGSAATDRHLAAYDACMADAAVRASYTAADPHAVFGIVRADCARQRNRVSADRRDALEQLEQTREATMPFAIDTLRDRRRTMDALYGIPNPGGR